MKSITCGGPAARQSRLISVLTFGNENGGVVKDIEFSGSVARRLASRIAYLKERERDIICKDIRPGPRRLCPLYSFARCSQSIN